jgi:hypothetical protein
VGRIIYLSRLLVAAVLVTAVLGLATACSQHDGPEIYAYECNSRTGAAGALPVSLSDAVAQQAAVNQAYRQCVERRSVRAAH